MKPMLSRKTTIMTVLFITSGSSCRFRQGTLSRSVVEKVTMGKSGCRRVVESRSTLGCSC